MNEDDHPGMNLCRWKQPPIPLFDPIPEAKRDITQFMKELEQAHHSGWDETKVRADLIEQIEKEREALKRWLDNKGSGTP